jgi:flagellar assembly factor FliW
MELITKYHGVKEYEEKDIIHFKKGIPGFENLKKYIVFPVEENEIFSILHSVEEQSLGLVVTSPFNVVKNYEFALDDNTIEELSIKEEGDVLVLSTVTLSSKVEAITVNLKAPIVINIKKGLGEQIILDKEEYSIKYPLIGE